MPKTANGTSAASPVLPALVGVILVALVATVAIFVGILLVLPVVAVVLGLYAGWVHRRRRRPRERTIRGAVRSGRPA